jgi:hypothetical protein
MKVCFTVCLYAVIAKEDIQIGLPDVQLVNEITGQAGDTINE